MSSKGEKIVSHKKYLSKKGLESYGIPTAVILFLLYFFWLGDAVVQGNFTLEHLVLDLPIGVFITLLICSLTLIPVAKMEVKKGAAPAMPLSKADHPVFHRYPKNLVLQALKFSAIGTLLFAFIPIGIYSFEMFQIPNVELGKVWYCIIKALYAAVYVTIMMKKVAYCAVSQVQDQYSAIVP